MRNTIIKRQYLESKPKKLNKLAYYEIQFPDILSKIEKDELNQG